MSVHSRYFNEKNFYHTRAECLNSTSVIMDFEVRAKKLEIEQQKRRDAIKKQKEREERLLNQQRDREEKEREEAIIRQEKSEELKLEKERIENEEYKKTGGVKFKMTLKPVLIEFEDDKIIMPESALIELNQLDAMSYGVLLFEIKTVSSNVSIIKFTDTVRKVTHCGVREFSASPGTVGIPSKVLESLEIDVKSLSDTSLCIKYVRLPKITYVKFEPKMNEFFAVGPVKLCLEENLRQHSTLTVGDILTVWYKGKSHVLSVVDMKPEAMGTLIDTDVEVDLDLSTEYKKMQERTVNIPLSSGIDNGISKFSTVAGNRLGSAIDNSNDNNNDNNNSSNRSSSSSSSNNSSSYGKRSIDIPSEPPESEKENIIKIKLRLPNGVGARRFYTTQPLKHLFEYVSSITDIDVNSILLSAQFPPRTIGISDFDKKFSDIGLNGGQELIHVNKLM